MYHIVNAYHKDITYPSDPSEFDTMESAQEFVDNLSDSYAWIIEEVTPEPPPPPIAQANYLVFEGREVPEPQTHRGAMTDREIREQQVMRTLYDVYPMAIRASSPQQAAMRAMALTRRISKYAVLPVDLFDFSTDLEEPQAQSLYLERGN